MNKEKLLQELNAVREEKQLMQKALDLLIQQETMLTKLLKSHDGIIELKEDIAKKNKEVEKLDNKKDKIKFIKSDNLLQNEHCVFRLKINEITGQKLNCPNEQMCYNTKKSLKKVTSAWTKLHKIFNKNTTFDNALLTLRTITTMRKYCALD